MQAQIRPHFLYNTLESISYLAQMGENSKIKVLAQSLIGLLRMTIGDIRSTITLEEELEGVRQMCIRDRCSGMASAGIILPDGACVHHFLSGQSIEQAGFSDPGGA